MTSEILHRSATMVFEKLKQVVREVAGSLQRPHPFDPLSPAEIEETVGIVRAEHSSLFYNAITVQEPRKAVMTKWLNDPENAPRPPRVADVVAIGKGSKVFDGLVDLDEKKIIQWESMEGVQPLVRRGAIRRKRRSSRLADYYGRPSSCRAYRAQRSQGHRTMRYYWDTTRRYAQSLLRS